MVRPLDGLAFHAYARRLGLPRETQDVASAHTVFTAQSHPRRDPWQYARLVSKQEDASAGMAAKRVTGNGKLFWQSA